MNDLNVSGLQARPSVSVAMATYNGARYILAQLDSLAAQTVLPMELVITDDMSSDSTGEIVAAFAQTAAFPVRWAVNPVRLGYRANFMKAASLCSGEVIAFCDQDDIWYATKLELATAALSAPDVMMFHHEARTVADGKILSETLDKVRNPRPLAGLRQSAPWQHPPGFAQVFRATLRDYDALWPQSSDFKEAEQVEAHDLWYYFLAGALGKIAFCATPLADYRQHENNTYGIGGTARRWHDRLTVHLENRAPLYQRMAAAAGRRAALLARARTDTAGSRAALMVLTDSSQAWRQLAIHYSDRARIYTGGSSTRLRAMWHLFVSRAYGRHGYWTFGQKTLLKDFLLGVVLAPVVRRFGREARGVDWAAAAGSGSAVSWITGEQISYPPRVANPFALTGLIAVTQAPANDVLTAVDLSVSA